MRNYDKLTYLTSKPVSLPDFASYMGLEIETVKDIIEKGVITNYSMHEKELMINHLYTAEKDLCEFIKSARTELLNKFKNEIVNPPGLRHYTLDDVYNLLEGNIIYLYKWQSRLRRRALDKRFMKNITKLNNRRNKISRYNAYLLLIGAIIDCLVYRKICKFF